MFLVKVKLYLRLLLVSKHLFSSIVTRCVFVLFINALITMHYLFEDLKIMGFQSNLAETPRLCMIIMCALIIIFQHEFV